MRATPTLVGILTLTAGIAVFSVQDVILKQLADSYPLSQAMTIRSLVALPLMLWIVRWQDGGLHTLWTPGWRRMLGRGVLNVLAYTSYYLGLAVLPMATTVALYFAAPLFISLLAPLLLGEPAPRAARLAGLIGFAGVLLIVQPWAGDGAALGMAALLPILGAFGYALSMIAARPLGRTETAAAMACWGNIGFVAAALAMSAVFGGGSWAEGSPQVLQFLVRPWIWPTPAALLGMAACGVIAAVGLTLLTQAYRVAPGPLVAPFEYSFMFWAVLFGWMFWDELPDFWAWSGIALIVFAGLLVLRAAPKAP